MMITPRKQTRIVTLHEPATFSKGKISNIVEAGWGTVNKILKQAKETESIDISRNVWKKKKNDHT